MALLEISSCSLEEAINSINSLKPIRPIYRKQTSYNKAYEEWILRRLRAFEQFIQIDEITNLFIADERFFNYNKELSEFANLANKLNQEEEDFLSH